MIPSKTARNLFLCDLCVLCGQFIIGCGWQRYAIRGESLSLFSIQPFSAPPLRFLRALLFKTPSAFSL
jgi:hypothetical protein